LRAQRIPGVAGSRSAGGEARLRLRFDAEGLFPALEIQAPPERVVELAEGVIRYGEVMAFPEVIPQRIAPAEEGISGPVTLAELGWPQIQMRGSGPMEARLFLSQADLGGPVRGVRLRLVGRATRFRRVGRRACWSS
jgi:hypothetical protein